MGPGLLLIGGGQNKQLILLLLPIRWLLLDQTKPSCHTRPRHVLLVLFFVTFLISKIKYLVLFYFVKLNIFIVFFLGLVF